MVTAVRILGGARLTAHVESRNIGTGTGAAQYRHAHALNDVVIIALVDVGVMAFDAFLEYTHPMDVLDHVGRDIVAAIGNSGAQVGDLQRCGEDFTLTDSIADDGLSNPASFTVYLVIKSRVGNKPAALARQVDAQFITISHRNHMVFPHFKSFACRAVLGTLVHHVFEAPTEVSVARRLQGRFEVDGRAVPVTTHTQSSVDIATVTGEHGACGDNALVKKYQTLCRLECRARRIGGHVGAVIQGFEPVVDQITIILAAFLAHE